MKNDGGSRSEKMRLTEIYTCTNIEKHYRRRRGDIHFVFCFSFFKKLLSQGKFVFNERLHTLFYFSFFMFLFYVTPRTYLALFSFSFSFDFLGLLLGKEEAEETEKGNGGRGES